MHFVATRTGLPETLVTAVLVARDRHQLGLRILPPQEPTDAEEQRVLRKAYPVYFPPSHIAMRFEDAGLHKAFIVETTGEEPAVVESVMAADLEYMTKLGIIAPFNGEI